MNVQADYVGIGGYYEYSYAIFKLIPWALVPIILKGGYESYPVLGYGNE